MVHFHTIQLPLTIPLSNDALWGSIQNNILEEERLFDEIILVTIEPEQDNSIGLKGCTWEQFQDHTWSLPVRQLLKKEVARPAIDCYTVVVFFVMDPHLVIKIFQDVSRIKSGLPRQRKCFAVMKVE